MNLAQALNLIRVAIGTSHTTAHGYTNPYGAQCLAFIAWYTEQLGYASIMPGYNAIDVFNLNPLRLGKPDHPEPGDMFFQHAIFDKVDLGHTGIVNKVTDKGIYGIAQNARNPSLTKGSPASEDFYPFSTIAGYLRPTFKGESMATKEQLTVLYQLAFPNQDVNLDWVKKFTDKDMSDALNDLRDDPSRQGYITKVINNAAAFEAAKSLSTLATATQLKPGLYEVK